MSSWVADRVALLGDAVHALNPSLAQGLNMTLQDVVSLVNTIRGCFESGDFSASALKPYEASRRKRTQFVQDQAERVAMITDSESRFRAWLAKRFLRKTMQHEDLMRLSLKMASGLLDSVGTLDMLRFLL